MKYLILQYPGHNRVYFKSSDKLALAELQVAAIRLDAALEKTELTELKGTKYLALETQKELSAQDLLLLSRLSFTYSIFKQETIEGSNYLLPLEKQSTEYLDPQLNTILKYQGKTNELFTKMMINVALNSSDFHSSERISLLDPLSGKGTTLFEAAIQGFDAFGIEQDQKAAHEASVYFKRYLQTERLKHLARERRIAGAGKKDARFIQEYAYANDKEAFKDTDQQRTLGMIHGDCREAGKYFKKSQFHLLVTDLPYGVFHGSKADQKGSNTRNPRNLLADSLPAWYQILKPGGVMVLAWNSFVLSRQALMREIESHELKVLDSDPYMSFEHMVDKSIKRDIILARKDV